MGKFKCGWNQSKKFDYWNKDTPLLTKLQIWFVEIDIRNSNLCHPAWYIYNQIVLKNAQ